MLVEVKVPVLAESVAEATLLTWHKKTGDPVKRGDSLIEIETDKVTLEVAALSDGTLAEIIKGDGETVSSDQVIAKIETDSTASDAAPEQQKTGTETQQNRPGKQNTDHVPEQQSLPVGEIPATPAKLSPAVRSLLEEHGLDAAAIPTNGDGNRLTREDVMHYLNTRQGSKSKQPGTRVAQPVTPQTSTTPAAVQPPPRTDASASEPAPVPGLDSTPQAAPAQDTGTTAADINTGQDTEAKTRTNTRQTGQQGRHEERVPMTRLRRRVAERLVSAQQEYAILTTFNEINMQHVVDLRNRHKAVFEQTHGIKLGYMSFFTRVVVESLKIFPVLNASVDGTDIIYHGYYDIGMAVSSEKGLVVPVVRDADMLSFAAIEKKIKEYTDKARSAQLTLEELTGGTFTITNGGVFGSLLSTPIINPPQSAILGMHTIQQRPVAEKGEIVIRPMMYVALSYDHRIIDGSDAVRFLVSVKNLLEDPARLLLQI